MTPSLRFVALAGSALVFTIAASAKTAIINKARSYLGPEAALDAVKSVHYIGTMTAPDPLDPKKTVESKIDIIFEKPDRHRIMITSDKTIAITALNGYEAWQRAQDPKDPSKWNQKVANVEQVKSLRANTWENVSFFRGIESRGGRVEVVGPAVLDGVTYNKVAFIYSPTIVFYRYFDLATGKLALTETGGGSTIREEGEIIVDGIRFPKRITTTTKIPGAKPPIPAEQTIITNFDQIKLNETFPDKLFTVPELRKM